MTDKREMLPETVFVVIEGEPFLSRAREYKRACNAAQVAWWDFARSLGADKVWGSEQLSALSFPRGHRLSGWRRADRKGRSYPAKGSDAAAAVAALPVKPQSRDVFDGAVVEDLSYFDRDNPKGTYGSGGIGIFFSGPWVGWIGDVMVAKIPHAGNAAANHLACRPNDVVKEPAASWTMPKGLRQISEAEFNLIAAQYKVDQERAAATEQAAA